MAITPMKVVSITSSRLMPSMPEVVVGAESGDPVGALFELKAGHAVLEAEHQRQGNQEPAESGEVSPNADQVLAARRQEQQNQQARERRQQNDTE